MQGTAPLHQGQVDVVLTRSPYAPCRVKTFPKRPPAARPTSTGPGGSGAGSGSGLGAGSGSGSAAWGHTCHLAADLGLAGVSDEQGMLLAHTAAQPSWARCVTGLLLLQHHR